MLIYFFLDFTTCEKENKDKKRFFQIEYVCTNINNKQLFIYEE